MESRFEVAGKIVDAKSPEQAVRAVFGRPLEGASIVVVEWTGKIITFIVGRKGRLKVQKGVD